jgi:hypothetical protein
VLLPSYCWPHGEYGSGNHEGETCP